MELWLLLSLVVIILWGLWGLALKYASLGVEWYHVYVASAIGAMIVYVIVSLTLLTLGKLSSTTSVKHIAIASLGGLFGALGGLMLIIALRLGEASIIVPLTSIYPAVTATLSIILLGETITLRKVVGVILAILAVVLLSSSD